MSEAETGLIPVEIQQKVEGEIISLVNGSSVLQVIDNQPQYENAVALTKTIKKLANTLEDDRDTLVRPRNNEVDAINAWFKGPKSRLVALEANLKLAIGRYQDKLEQIRLDAQRKADEEARKERERIEAQARSQREKEAEQRRIEEAARKRQEDARKAEEEAAKRAREAKDEDARKKAEEEAAIARDAANVAEKEAEKARGKADSAAGAAALKESVAESVVAVAIAPQIAKAEGVSTTCTYSANVTDKAAAVRHCLEAGKLHLVDLNMKTIGKLVVAEKEQFVMPGIEVVKTAGLRVKV
jgi:hypothetical protein